MGVIKELKCRRRLNNAQEFTELWQRGVRSVTKSEKLEEQPLLSG